MLTRPEDIARFAAETGLCGWETYGRGDRPPGDLARALRPFVDAGLLVTSSKRENGVMQYLVKRSRTISRTGRSSLPPRAPRNYGRAAQSDLTRVFQCLVRAACRGLPCPSYSEIARRCSIDRQMAGYRVRQLASKGRVAVLTDAHTGWRVITITSGPHAGKHTMMARSGLLGAT